MCVYRQNTTIFIRSILATYYIKHNYMFRPLMLAIFRLYMYLSSSYTTDTTCVGCVFGCGEGVCVGPRSRFCVSGGRMVWNSIISLFKFYF